MEKHEDFTLTVRLVDEDAPAFPALAGSADCTTTWPAPSPACTTAPRQAGGRRQGQRAG